MYHPGKVIKIFRGKRAKTKVQATVSMWDDNLLTLDVYTAIIPFIKEGDTVLVDYSPYPNFTAPVPKQIIVKILDKKDAEPIWNEYKRYHEKQKEQMQGSKGLQFGHSDYR
jgi:hypothetical protein